MNKNYSSEVKNMKTMGKSCTKKYTKLLFQLKNKT